MQASERKQQWAIDPDSRAPAPLLSILLILAALAIAWAFDSRAASLQDHMFLDIATMLLLLSVVFYLVARWNPWAGRWLLVVGLAILFFWMALWLQNPVILVLLILPVSISGSTMGTGPALITATVQSALLFFLPFLPVLHSSTIPMTPPNVITIVTILAMWSVVLTVLALERPLQAQTEWLSSYLDDVYAQVDAIRNERADMEQTLAVLDHANRQLEAANERISMYRLAAEEAQKTKSTFVAKVSHEFRTPLNMILGLVELIVESPDIYAVVLPPELEQDLQVVFRNCRHLANLVDDVLDLTRIESGRLTLHKDHVDLSLLVEEAVSAVQPLLRKKGLTLDVSCPTDLPSIFCDRTRIRQVILNLVSNAARFTDEGGIRVEVIQKGRHLQVSVIDTGPGISPEISQRIFEPFCQGMDSTWRDKGGSGLGLSISRQFVQLHQGRLWLESEPGSGSRFIFDLPVIAPDEITQRPYGWIREDRAWREGVFRESAGLSREPNRQRIVVKDSHGILLESLARYGDVLELIPASTIEETIHKAKQLDVQAVIINSDSRDQLEVDLTDVSNRLADMPVFGSLVTAPVSQALLGGAAGHLVKPISSAMLADAMRQAVRNKEIDSMTDQVLVVDDDPDVLHLFTHMLHRYDPELTVTTASNGKDALEILRDSGSAGEGPTTGYDIVLLDVNMPVMDGWETLERIRADRRCDDVIVYMVSAQDPGDQAIMSPFLVSTYSGGFSTLKLLRSSLDLAALLRQPDSILDPVPQ